MRKNKILIFAYSKDHVSKIVSTMRRLSGRYDKIIIVGLNSEGQAKLKELNIPYKTPGDYVSEKIYEEIGKESLLLTRSWGDLKVKDKTLRELLTHKGMSYWDIIDMNFSTYLFEHAERLQHVKLIKCILEQEKPDEIIVSDEDAPGKAAVVVADSMKIPVSKIKPSLTKNLKYLVWKYLRPYLIRYAYRLKELQVRFFGKKLAGSRRYRLSGPWKSCWIIGENWFESLINVETS